MKNKKIFIGYITVFSSLWAVSAARADFGLIDMSNIAPEKSLNSLQVMGTGKGEQNAMIPGAVTPNNTGEQSAIIGIDNGPDAHLVLGIKSGMLIAANTEGNDKLISETAAPGTTPTEEGYDLGGGLTIGPGYLQPGVKLDTQYDDNLTYSATDKIGTFAGIITPHLSYVIPGRKLKINVESNLEAGFYEASSIDDYLDARIYGSADYQPTSRIYSQLAAEFRKSHDGRGTGRAQGGLGITQTSPDEWHRWGIGGKFGYGALTAKGRVELEGEYISKRYDNNRSLTFVRDLDELNGTARFFYRFRPKTYLLFETRASQTIYQEDAPGLPTLDSLTTRQLFGVTWLATYKTTGFLKLGRINKNYSSGQRADDQAFTWEIGVDWKPRTYSTVSLKTDQDFVETNGTGNAGDRRQVSLSWNHNWRTRLSTNLELLYGQETYAPDPRQDEFYETSAKVKYDFRRWLNLEAGYRFSNLDSTEDTFSYDQNVFEFTADFTF